MRIADNHRANHHLESADAIGRLARVDTENLEGQVFDLQKRLSAVPTRRPGDYFEFRNEVFVLAEALGSGRTMSENAGQRIHAAEYAMFRCFMLEYVESIDTTIDRYEEALDFVEPILGEHTWKPANVKMRIGWLLLWKGGRRNAKRGLEKLTELLSGSSQWIDDSPRFVYEVRYQQARALFLNGKHNAAFSALSQLQMDQRVEVGDDDSATRRTATELKYLRAIHAHEVENTLGTLFRGAGSELTDVVLGGPEALVRNVSSGGSATWMADALKEFRSDVSDVLDAAGQVADSADSLAPKSQSKA